MFRRQPPTMLICLIGLTASVLYAQSSSAPPSPPITIDDPNEPPPPPSAGFWPTEKMWDGAMHRIADAVADRYGFDDDQRYLTRQLFKERFPQWAEENRGNFQPLLNEWFEMAVYHEAPDPNTVAVWATNVIPIADEFDGLITNLSDDMRVYMTEDQQIDMEGELAAFRTGLTFAKNRLRAWEAGEFNPARDWFHGQEFREAERERRQAVEVAVEEARESATQKALQKYGGEKRDDDPWAIYVEEFIKKYQLEAEQTEEARALLAAYRKMRDDYLERNSTKLDELDARFAAAETPEQELALAEEVEKLAGPIERHFQVLKEKLNKLPTRAQRRAAAEREEAAEQAAEESPTEPAAVRANE